MKQKLLHCLNSADIFFFSASCPLNSWSLSFVPTLPHFSFFFSCVIVWFILVSPLLSNVLFLFFSSHCFNFCPFSPHLFTSLLLSYLFYSQHFSPPHFLLCSLSCIPIKTHISTWCACSGEQVVRKRREEKVDKRKTSESREEKETMKDSEETLYRDFSFSVYVHVIVVRRRPGCAVSSRQAVIGWNIHL